MTEERKRLGDMLLEEGLITREQLEKTLQEKDPSEKLGDALLKQGYITEQQLIKTLERQLNIPHISLYRYPFNEKVIQIVPKEIAERHRLIPLKKEGDKLFIAMADPMDYYAIEDLRLATGFQIDQAIATKDDINRAIAKHYEIDNSVEGLFDLTNANQNEPSQTIADDSPVVKLVNQLLKSALNQGASDIHFDPQETKINVRFRIDGLLQTEKSLPKHMQKMIIARIKIMANLDITESRLPQDGRIKTTLGYQTIDLRVSILPTIYGEKVVMRILDLSGALNELDKLGFNSVNKKRFLTMVENPNGIVLITGPTGAGKSSTLYAALNHLNSEAVNIITIEDPVEYQLSGINQVEINTKTGLTFAAGLRAMLRQDPDIVMVGEIRDTETGEIAVRASLTGHLVLSTLHTNDSIATITRLIDMGIEPFLVGASLSGIVSQRLIRRICRDCQQSVEPGKGEKEIFAKRGMTVEKVAKGKGCPNCKMTGYKGRLAIHEVLSIDEQLKQMIMDNEPVQRMKEYAMKKGTIFLIDDGLLKVKQGLTTTEEVLRVAVSR